MDKARELIEMLQKCEDKDRLVVTFEPGFGGLGEAQVACEDTVGGMDCRASFEYVRVVAITSGNGPHLQKQGYNVLGYVPKTFPQVVHEIIHKKDTEP